MDPFHTLVTRGWAVETGPTLPVYVHTLGTYYLIIRRHDREGQVSRGFWLYGNDLDDLMVTAATAALRIEQGQSTPGRTFIKDTWMP